MQRNRRVLTGTHFEMGNWACTEGAIAAGCNFAAGYPITPASEIAESAARFFPAFLRGKTLRVLRGRGANGGSSSRLSMPMAVDMNTERGAMVVRETARRTVEGKRKAI